MAAAITAITLPHMTPCTSGTNVKARQRYTHKPVRATKVDGAAQPFVAMVTCSQKGNRVADRLVGKPVRQIRGGRKSYGRRVRERSAPAGSSTAFDPLLRHGQFLARRRRRCLRTGVRRPGVGSHFGTTLLGLGDVAVDVVLDDAVDHQLHRLAASVVLAVRRTGAPFLAGRRKLLRKKKAGHSVRPILQAELNYWSCG